MGIAGAERFDLGIGQRRFVDVLGGADGRLARHDLPDELLLALDQLIEVAVESVFGDIGEYAYRL